jgi:hypothetical protein
MPSVNRSVRSSSDSASSSSAGDMPARDRRWCRGVSGCDRARRRDRTGYEPPVGSMPISFPDHATSCCIPDEHMDGAERRSTHRCDDFRSSLLPTPFAAVSYVDGQWPCRDGSAGRPSCGGGHIDRR